MGPFRKRQLGVLLAIGLWAGAPAPAQTVSATDQAARLDQLFAELRQPGREDWERVEGEITKIWAQSGSASMDLLLVRGNAALEAQDYPAAVEHFSALVDHAPDFAEGWNGRATTFYLMGEYALSMTDVEHVLALEPRHFGALSGLAFMLEAMGETELALRALREVQALNPNRPNINDAVVRLQRMTGEAEL
jgi:tetratricopeptide (TPR) repeat protein